MKNQLLLTVTLITCFIPAAIAGGDPDFVPYPEGYRTTDINYATVNRENGKQVAVLYANKTAIDSLKKIKTAAPGSRIIMEIYKIKKDADGKPVKGTNGVHEKGEFTGTAVMLKQSEWPSAFPKDHRAGDWGFARYAPDGKPKENNLECAKCHIPHAETDYIITHDELMQAAAKK